MKIRTLALVLLSVSSMTYGLPLMSQKDFKKLSPEKQLQYVSGVQKILVEMAARSPLMAGAEEKKKNSRTPANTPDPTDPSAFWSADQAPGFRGATRVGSPTPTPTPAPAPAPAPAAKTESANTGSNTGTDYRCLHSGWVVEGDKCQAPSRIPNNWGLPNLMPDIHKCQNGQSLCNPLIFGLKLAEGCAKLDDEGCAVKARPFCSTEVFMPTADCYRQANANNKSGTRVAVELLNEDKPDGILSDYKSKLTKLCDPEGLKNNRYMNYRGGQKRSDESKRKAIEDVTETCAWARKQIEELNQSVASSDKSGQSSPDSTKPPQQGSQK